MSLEEQTSEAVVNPIPIPATSASTSEADRVSVTEDNLNTIHNDVSVIEDNLVSVIEENRAVSDEEDDEEEDDPDFDPTSSTNTPQENVSEDDSDVDSEKNFEENGSSHSSSASKIQIRGRKRTRESASIDELLDNTNNVSKSKEPKLISVNSNQEIKLRPEIPKTRITFLSGKASDIGLGGLFKKGVGGGLSGVLAALQSKKVTTMTTLERTKLDWQNFKQSEGLEDELKSQLKSRNGFLEKRDFLERTDLRQFENEKNIRAKSRRNPLGS